MARPRSLRILSRIPSSKGVVSVWKEALEPHPSGRWRFRQTGHRWDKGFLVTVTRWEKEEVGTDPTQRRQVLREWEEWEEVLRSSERVRKKRQPVLPAMTEAELDAWSEHVRPYVERNQGTTLAAVAGCLDGWDDVTSFWPGRTPFDYETSLWDWGDAMSTRLPARERAYALARAALQRLVRRGLAAHPAPNWWTRPESPGNKSTEST